MLSSRIARLSFSAAVALALPIGGAVALSAGPAGAAKNKAIVCTKLSGTESAAKLKKCSGNTGTKSKSINGSTLLGGGPINWKNGKSTTISAPVLGTGTKCPAGTSDDVTISGTVTADTTGSATVGGPYSAEICVASSGALSLAPGTSASIG
jgi:hypothetical protein